MDLSITTINDAETISTTIRLERSFNIRAIRPRLFKNGSPDGVLTLTIKDTGTTLASSTVALSALDAAQPDHFHGYILFEFDSLVAKRDPEEAYLELTLELSLSGHTDDASNYISWCHNFSSDAFVDSYGTIPLEDDMTLEELTHFSPYGLEIYGF